MAAEHSTRSDWTDEQVLALVREHERLVRAYLRSMGCRGDRVEDLAQETFLRLFTRPIEDRGPNGLRAYLCVAARNLYINSLRSDASKPILEELDSAWGEFEGRDGGSAYLDALRGCLETLPARTREVLQLRFGSEMSRTEIAARTQLSLGGVKSLLLRSKESLKACVERKLGEGKIGFMEAVQ